MANFDKILIVQTAFIGDVILATSLIEKLHAFYPKCEIDFLLRKGNEQLLENHPLLHKVLIWDKKRKKYSNLFTLFKFIRKKRYDAVFNLQRFASSGFLTAFSKAKMKVGFRKNPFSLFFNQKYEHNIEDGVHEIDRNHKLIAAVTDENPAKPKLYPSACKSELQQKPYVCMAPTSVWFTKQLPEDKWLKLIAHTSERIYLLGAPSDKEQCENLIQKSVHQDIISMAGKLALLESASLMQGAQMNFVNDSAPLHLTSAVNAPVTAFFCSTVPKFGFTPLSEKQKIIEISENLDCRPCGLHGFKKCPLGHFKCGNDIEMQVTTP